MAKSLVSCFLTHGAVVNLILETMWIAEHRPVLDIVDIIIIIIADQYTQRFNVLILELQTTLSLSLSFFCMQVTHLTRHRCAAAWVCALLSAF